MKVIGSEFNKLQDVLNKHKKILFIKLYIKNRKQHPHSHAERCIVK